MGSTDHDALVRRNRAKRVNKVEEVPLGQVLKHGVLSGKLNLIPANVRNSSACALRIHVGETLDTTLHDPQSIGEAMLFTQLKKQLNAKTKT